MKKQISLFVIFLLVGGHLFPQSPPLIKGKITNATNGLPIPNCSVFITNTSRGTVSNNAGEFELVNVPKGTYDLIVSSIGYETRTYTYHSSQLPLQLAVNLNPKQEELSAIVVEPFEKNGWERWGKFFTNGFIGTTDNARKCTIKNREVLRFRFSKTFNRLTVVAAEPMLIENKALGYTIQYQLEKFVYDFDKEMISYYGYPLFRQMTADKKKQQEQWDENRKKAYYGSMVHFMKSLYDRQLTEQGFEVKLKIKFVNQEKQRVKKLMIDTRQQADTFERRGNKMVKINKDKNWAADSSVYYLNIMEQADVYEGDSPPLPADSLVQINPNNGRVLFFPGKLDISYRNRHIKEDPAQSSIYLITPRPVFIDPTGNYYPAKEVFILGHWSLFETIANTLPLDYDPESGKEK